MQKYEAVSKLSSIGQGKGQGIELCKMSIVNLTSPQAKDNLYSMPAPAFEVEGKPSLPFHERFTAWLIISVLIFLTTLNIALDEPAMPLTDSEVYLVDPLIQITVEGAVEFPGVYQVKKGALIKEVLKLAKPLPDANLKKIKLDAPITRRRVIKVPKK